MSDLCFTRKSVASEHRLGQGAKQGVRESNESIATVQVTGDGSLDKGGSRRGGEKWSHSGYITKVESMGFPNLNETKFLSKFSPWRVIKTDKCE